MGMRIDKAGCDDTTLRINRFIRIECGRIVFRSDIRDDAVLDMDTSLNTCIVLIGGDEISVFNTYVHIIHRTCMSSGMRSACQS